MTAAPREKSDISLLELIIQTAPDAIVTADETGAILSFSPAAERIFGYAEPEVIGRNVSCLMPEPFRAEHDGYMRRYMETGEKRIIGIGREVRALRKSGDVFVAELAIGEQRVGRHRVFTGFVRDASDRAAAEVRARDLQRRLERVARMQMLGEVSTALAHEINQPLAAISNFSRAALRTLAGENPDLTRIAAHLDAIAEQSRRAGEIIRRMRKMIDRGRADIRADDINDIIQEAVRVGRATGEHQEPTIHLDLARDLPRVMADRIQIQQVIVNLMNNALDAIAGEDHDITITSDLARPGDKIVLKVGVRDGFVVVSVIDSGVGIRPEVADRLFDPLVSTKISGLGIGLAVCRSIIEAHGGRIWAENLDHGAAFHFTLPIAKDAP